MKYFILLLLLLGLLGSLTDEWGYMGISIFFYIPNGTKIVKWDIHMCRVVKILKTYKKFKNVAYIDYILYNRFSCIF